MSDSPTVSAAAQAQTDADAAWAQHDAARQPVRDELVVILGNLEGVTGLQAGPGSERLADAMLDFAEFHAQELGQAYAARQQALAAQASRDSALEAEPVAPAPVEPGMLETGEPLAIREWLKSANDSDVTTALLGVTNTDAQRTWAQTLQGWCRADGNTAQVLAAINPFLAAGNPIDIADGGVSGGTGGTTSYRGTQQIPAEASAADPVTEREHASDELPPDVSVDDLVAWINHGADATLDVDRARRAFLAEQARPDGGRPEYLVALSEILGVKSLAPSEPEAQSAGPLPLYEFVGPADTQIDTGEWPVAAAHGADGQALYTHPETDVAGGAPMDIPADSMWKVYDGETTPFPGPVAAPEPAPDAETAKPE